MRGPVEQMSYPDRYWSKVDTSAGPDGCWPWLAGVNPKTGYGIFHREGRRTINAHRYGALLAGLIAEGDPRHVDHSCHNGASCPPGPCPHRLCQNPTHFDAVTSRVNVNRSHNSNIQKTHCPRGHEYTQENTRVYVRANTEGRSCRECARLADIAPGRKRENIGK